MNAGFASLTKLKEQLLAASLRASTAYDAQILAIGRGVAAQFECVCNRKFARVVNDRCSFPADRRHYYLPRFPVESITLCEKQDTVRDGWQTLTDLIQSQDLEKGYIFFAAIQGVYWSNLRITYTGGFWWDTSEDGIGVCPTGAATLPDDLMLGWYHQCKHIWNMTDKLGVGISQDPAKQDQGGKVEMLKIVLDLIDNMKRYQIS